MRKFFMWVMVPFLLALTAGCGLLLGVREEIEAPPPPRGFAATFTPAPGETTLRPALQTATAIVAGPEQEPVYATATALMLTINPPTLDPILFTATAIIRDATGTAAPAIIATQAAEIDALQTQAAQLQTEIDRLNTAIAATPKPGE